MFKRLVGFLSEIPLLIHLILVILFVIGTMILSDGINNIQTYEERNKHAVDIDARISHIQTEQYYDSSTDETRTKHTVYLEYMYDGTSYETTHNIYTSDMSVGDTVKITIDMTQPWVVIHNDGEYHVFAACVIYAIILATFIVSYIRFKKGKELSGIFYFSLPFFFGAIIFTVMAFVFLKSSDIFAFFGMLLGAAIFGLIAFMFGFA